MSAHVESALGKPSFSCPHCGTLAHQTWFHVYAREYEKDKHPSMLESDIVEKIEKNPDLDKNQKMDFQAWAKRILAGEIFIEEEFRNAYARDVNNICLSQCYSCNRFALWRADALTFPRAKFEIAPNDDLSLEIKQDFNEAAAILDSSPRGATALLRLALQKLLKQIGESGENINDDIGSLVQKGLDVRIQKALDLVRVFGNNAVHPGSIDMRDNRETAVRLFNLINLIAHDRITHPREIEALYDASLTPGQKAAIAKRDGRP